MLWAWDWVYLRRGTPAYRFPEPFRGRIGELDSTASPCIEAPMDIAADLRASEHAEAFTLRLKTTSWRLGTSKQHQATLGREPAKSACRDRAVADQT